MASMLAKKLKSKQTHFSSEDSQNTDHSMDSSLEIEESNAKNSHANKFNQLRETINQLFLANPELAEELKFEQNVGAAPEEKEIDSPTHFSPPVSPAKKGLNESQGVLEEKNQNNSSAKFWGAISKEMIKPQANSKIPSLNQINHILNIFKTKFEKTEQLETSFSPTKTALKKPKADFRIQSAKGGNPDNKQLSSARKENKSQGQNLTSPQNNQNLQEEGEDGVSYYSSRKKIHLKLKQKRVEREMEEHKKKKELDAVAEKVAKEREQKLMMYTLAELDQELKRGATIKLDEDRPGEGSSRNNLKLKPRGSGSRKNSLKTKGDIFERLTKDMTNKNATDEEDEINMKKTFISPFAESLYKDMKAFGDPEAFKKIAHARIMNYKKEFKEKLSKQKGIPAEGMRFSKEKSRNMNMFLPDFEKASAVANKESVFNKKEVPRDPDEKENPEQEVLAKFQKIRHGNILEFWQEAKDLIQ
jgi:hypothetical protein